MKKTKLARFSFRTLLAAATLGVGIQTAQAATLSYSADDLGSGRFVADVYTATDINYNPTDWLLGFQPIVAPVLTVDIVGIQNGSISFRDIKNGDIKYSATSLDTNGYLYVYQAGLVALDGSLLGVGVGFGAVAVTIPSVQVGAYTGFVKSYQLRNPNTYNAVLNLTGSTVNGDRGRNAINSDAGVNTSLNLYGTNRINGATLVDNIYTDYSSTTTFNGNVAGNTWVHDDSVINYTSQANQIYGDINTQSSYPFDGEGTVLNFAGSNKVNGVINLNAYATQININGTGVEFTGNVTVSDIDFTNGGSLTLGESTYVNVAEISFNGNNAKLNVGSNVRIDAAFGITTSDDQTGTIEFAGSANVNADVGVNAALSEIILQGAGSVVRISGATKAVDVKLNAASTLVLAGGLNSYNTDAATLGTLNYFSKNSEVQVGQYWDGVGGTAPTVSLNSNISTDKNNNGILKFLGGRVYVTGTVASSAKELSLIAIGGTNSGNGDDDSTNSVATGTFGTDVYAHDVALNGNVAALEMESGKNIKGTSLTTNIKTTISTIPSTPSVSNVSALILNGGTQLADFANIGTSASKIGFVISGVDGSSASTFTGNVFANNIVTYGGVTNFKQGVKADNVDLDAGTINFNAPSGTTPGSVGTIPSGGNTSIANALNFHDAGTANFYQGANVGSINFNGYMGTVNVSAGKNLTGDVRNYDLISASADGTVNFLGGTSALTGNVGTGTGNSSIFLLHAGVDSQSNLTVTGDIFSVETRLSRNSTLTAQGDITGDVTNSSTVAAGTLRLVENYSQTVSGDSGVSSGKIGSSTAPLRMVETGLATGTNATTFNGMVYANTLKYNGAGNVELNGSNAGSSTGGIVGTVDFSGSNGALYIGDDVNLTFGTSATGFANANNASLTFVGTSTVNGQIGAAGTFSGTNPVPANSTPGDIYAGATGERVTFNGKVYVSDTTFHVTGLGTVDFNDDLVGPLVFEDSGVVNFAHTKGIVGITPGNGTATTNYDGEGTINFLGSTTQDGEIGVFNAITPIYGRLNTVNFHSGTTAANVTQNLNYSVYSWYTNIGNTGTAGTAPTTTTAIIGRNPNNTENIHLGTVVAMADDTTTVYTAGAQYLTLNGGPLDDSYVDFVHTKNADGTLTLGTIAGPVAITQSRFDANLYTNNGTLGFAISAEPYTNSTAPGTYNGVVAADSALSSSINGKGYGVENNGNGSFLNMSGDETVQVAFLGSMKDNVRYTLIDVVNNDDSYGTGPMPYTLLDNSFTIDTTLDRSNADGDLRITTHRDDYTYLDKSGTTLLGLRSYDMAYRLGELAAAGTGYSAGLQVVFNKLDLDQWGYGNNEANLARQLYLLTPSGDGAAVKAGTGLTAQAVNAVLDGSGSLSTRATPQRSYWVRAYGSHDNQTGSGEYAGYNINGGGVTVGTDYQIGDSVVGVAVGYGKATASSSGLRDGDKAKVDSTIAGLFFRTPIGQYFLNAMIDGAKHRTKTERQTAVGERANGDYTGTEFGGAIQFGRKFELSDKNESLTPILSVNYARYKQAAYAETGAGDIGLNYTEQKYSQSDARLSLRYAVEKSLGEGIASSFSAALGYKHLLSSPTYNNTVNFVGDTNTFDVAGFHETHKGSLVATLAYNYNPSKGVTYTIDYNGEAKSGYNAHSLGFRATWEY